MYCDDPRVIIDTVDAPEPIPAANISYRLVGFTAIEIFWDPPFNNYDSIRNFEIRYRPSAFPNNEAIEYIFVIAAAPPYTISGLDIDTTYLLSVAGENSVGTGRYIADISATTVTPGQIIS